MGKALLNAAEEDVKMRGAKGMVAWGMALPFWMKASWFKKQGYIRTDKKEGALLLWKPFTAAALPPKWIRPKKKPEAVPGKVTVTAFTSGWCSALNGSCERTKRAASEFGNKVVFREIHTSNRDILMEWGLEDGIFIDNKEISTGPPLSYAKIKKRLEKKVKKLKS